MSLLLLFKSHLGLTLVVTLCNSIISLMELRYLCFILEKYPDFSCLIHAMFPCFNPVASGHINHVCTVAMLALHKSCTYLYTT